MRVNLQIKLLPAPQRLRCRARGAGARRGARVCYDKAALRREARGAAAAGEAHMRCILCAGRVNLWLCVLFGSDWEFQLQPGAARGCKHSMAVRGM